MLRCWSFRTLTRYMHVLVQDHGRELTSKRAFGLGSHALPPAPSSSIHVPSSRAPAEQDQRSDAQYEGEGDTDRPRGERAVPIERFMDSQKNEGEPNVGIGGAREGGRIVYRLPRNGAVDSLNEPGWVYRPLEPQNAIACTFV